MNSDATFYAVRLPRPPSDDLIGFFRLVDKTVDIEGTAVLFTIWMTSLESVKAFQHLLLVGAGVGAKLSEADRNNLREAYVEEATLDLDFLIDRLRLQEH